MKVVGLFIRDLTPEDEERIIDHITMEVVNRGLDPVAVIVLESIKPMTFIGSQITLVFAMPFLSLFGDIGIDYIKFFEKSENVERLLQRIEQKVKLRDDETKQAKEHGKLISQRFGIHLDLLPGFSMQEVTTHNGPNWGIIGITRTEQAGGGFLRIYVTAADSPPNDFQFTSYLQRNEARQWLMNDDNLSLVENGKQAGKLRGHQMSAASYEWSDEDSHKGLVEYWAFWCNRTKRFFVLSLRTRALTGQQKEKNQIRELKLVLGSLRCH